MEDKGPLILAVCWTFTAIGLFFVAVRLFVRIHIQRTLQSDDLWIILGTICAVLSSVFVHVSVQWGNGQHFDTLDLEEKQNVIKWMMIAYVPGIETLGFPKLGIIVLLTKLLAPGRTHLIVLWGMGVICCLSLAATVTTLLLQCSPPRALWTLTMPRDCLDPDVIVGLAVWASTMSAFLDFYLAIYPAVVMSTLKLAPNKKFSLCIILGTGVVSGCVGIKKATAIPALRSHDISFDLCDPLYWTSIEGNLVIVAACIPVMHPLFEMAKGRVPTSVKKNGKRGYAEGSGQEHELRSNRRQVDDFGFTVMGREGSQESINNADKQSAVSTTTTPAPDDPHNPNGIVKTVNFTLEYSNDGEPVPGEPRRWAAV